MSINGYKQDNGSQLIHSQSLPNRYEAIALLVLHIPQSAVEFPYQIQKGKQMQKTVCYNYNTDNYSNEYVCDDCGIAVKVTFSPYGASQMATIDCRICGVSYDTDLDPKDYEIK